jgi:hypothetical protein
MIILPQNIPRETTKGIKNQPEKNHDLKAIIIDHAMFQSNYRVTKLIID